MVMRDETFLDARQKYRSEFPSLAVVDAAQPRGFRRSQVDLLAHRQGIQPFGQADIGALYHSPKPADYLELYAAIRATFEPGTVAASI
jgi:hypothetical protein